MTGLRRLPIVVDPVPGEGLDSWLEALSRRLATPVSELLPVLGLGQARRRGARLPAFAVCLRARESSRVAAATGIAPAAVRAMTLARYDAVALRVDHTARRVVAQYVWARRRGTWFCPRCLADNGGRWLLRWRLGWSFACTRHRCLLADRCPSCGQVPQRRTMWLRVPQASRCLEHPASAGRRNLRCDTDLTTAPVVALAADHPVLHAQDLVDTMLTTGTAGFGLYTGIPAARLLTDLAVLAPRILRTTATPVDDPVLAGLADAYRAALTDPSASATPGARGRATTPTSAPLTAVVTTRVLAVLSSTDEHTAATMLATMGTPGDATRRLLAAHHEPVHTKTLTPTLTGVLRHARRTVFPPSPRACLPGSARPRSRPGWSGDLLGGPQTCPDRDRSAQLPVVFWPWWTLRLAPHWGVQRLFRGALACLTLAAGTALSITRATALLGPGVSADYVAATLRRLTDDPAWNAQRTALRRIAHHLDTHGSPIDYARRRTLDYTTLLPEPRWRTLVARTGIRRSHGTLRTLRCVLFETLSGLPAALAPAAFAPGTKEQRDAVADHPTLLTTHLAHELDLAAREFLAAHGIDEPVTWQPPRTLAEGLHLPGPDPDTLATEPLHPLLAAGIPLGRAAAQSGMSPAAARYLLTQSPPGTAADPVQEHLQRRLPSDLFRDLYENQGRSLSTLAAHYRVNRRRITRLATAYDIPLRDPHRPPAGITREWLTEHYVDGGRSAEELAAELGLHPNTVLRWCRRHDLAVRPAGAHGHRSARHSTDTVPPELHPALTGTRPWKRLAAFAETRNHATLQDAAAALGLDRKTLDRYVRRLENELGHQLVHRDGTDLRTHTTLTIEGNTFAQTIAAQLNRQPELAPAALAIRKTD
ncbi:TniQ family protein [Umezawaea sp.]|uniref:TniQ family protein n=1 Tax=Umezawaea sp. TaxID=1955258 RepID=UPI002ED63AC2